MTFWRWPGRLWPRGRCCSISSSRNGRPGAGGGAGGSPVARPHRPDDLLAFASVLDAKLGDMAQAHVVPEPLVREACVLHRLPTTSTAYWQGWYRLRAK